MKNLLTTLCLTIAVLLGSMGCQTTSGKWESKSAASPPVQAPLIKDRQAVVDWLTVLLERLPPLEHERGNRRAQDIWDVDYRLRHRTS
jgi:hypothetical protein